MSRHLIIGLGQIGRSFLKIVKEQGLFCKEQFFCIDSNPTALNDFLFFGGDANHFYCIKVSLDNYSSVLEQYGDGDFVFDFANEINNIELLQLALKKGIHYLSVADSFWNLNDPEWVSLHQHFKKYYKLSKQKRITRTSIIEFGMNPGLVSCFAKSCLEKIVKSDMGSYISKNRKSLLSLLKRQKYGTVARRIGLKKIIEVDNDDQCFDIQIKPGTIYSTWSPESFYHEELAAPEMIFGTWKEFSQFDRVRDCDFLDYYISLRKSGIDCKENVFSPQGMMTGSLIAHEEVFSMSYFFKSICYKPTAFFVYKPCDLAKRSIELNRFERSPDFCLLKRENLISGGESVGVIMQGKHFQTSYFGNLLDSSDIDETATVLQVSASVYAAYKYILRHPYKGFLFPEDLDAKELLEDAQQYLKAYVFQTCPSVSPSFGNETRKKKQKRDGLSR